MNFSKYQKYSILAVADFISIMLAGIISYYILAYYIDVTMSVTMGLCQGQFKIVGIRQSKNVGFGQYN